MKEIEQITEFMKIVEKLGTVQRDIKLTDGTLQSDTSHTLNLCLMTQLVAPYLQTPVDAIKMLELALVHDLVEAECGDIPLCAQKGNTNLKELKKQQEFAAITRYRDMLPAPVGQKVFDLFNEYENKTSREAQVVYILDKLEADFQAYRYGEGDVRYWAEGAGGEWYYHCVMSGETPEKPWLAKLTEPFLNQLEALALHNCRQAIKKSNIVVEGDFPQENYQTNSQTEIFINFMNEAEQLSLIKRNALLFDGTNETDADHIVKLMYLVMLTTPFLLTPLDYDKILPMALVHDLVEARSGDFSLAGQNSHLEWKAKKQAAEQEAIEYFRNLLVSPTGQTFYDLFQEYESRHSREAQVLWVLDKIDGTWQPNQYHDGDITYWANYENGSWYYQYNQTKKPQVAALNEPILTALEDNNIRLTIRNIEKCAIKICAE